MFFCLRHSFGAPSLPFPLCRLRPGASVKRRPFRGMGFHVLFFTFGRQFPTQSLVTLICFPDRNGRIDTLQGRGLRSAPLVARAWIPPLSMFFRNILTRDKGLMKSIRATTFLANLNGLFRGIHLIDCKPGPLTLRDIHRV